MIAIIRFFLLAVLAAPAIAEYDHIELKSKLSGSSAFKVSEWKQTAAEDVWIAKTSLETLILSVGPNTAGFMEALSSEDKAIGSLFRCLELAQLTFSPIDDDQAKSIYKTVMNAASSLSEVSYISKNIQLEVSPTEIVGGAYLSCTVKPI